MKQGMSIASHKLYRIQMDWGNPKITCTGNKNLIFWSFSQRRWDVQTFHGGTNNLFCATASLHHASQAHSKDGDSFMEEKGKNNEHLLPKMTFSVHCDGLCNFLLSVVTNTCHYKQRWDHSNHRLLQHDERSDVIIGDCITSVYTCYLAPRELISSFSYVCCQTKYLKRFTWSINKGWGPGFLKDPRKMHP